jgi:hypothetical protein
VRTISKRPLFPLNLIIPSPAQKDILDSLSVHHKLEKSQETWSNHPTQQLISPPSQCVPHSHSALCLHGHSGTEGTSVNEGTGGGGGGGGESTHHVNANELPNFTKL